MNNYNNFKEQEWDKVNHGGSQTSNKSKKRAVFIGRFQPYSYGHISLIKQKIIKGIPVLILVRDIEPDAKNPFTTEQTVSMIKKYHAAHNEDVLVQIIPDIESINFGRGVGYEVNNYIPKGEVQFVSATSIRESIKNGDIEWKKMVDPSIQSDVEKYLDKNKTLI